MIEACILAEQGDLSGAERCIVAILGCRWHSPPVNAFFRIDLAQLHLLRGNTSHSTHLLDRSASFVAAPAYYDPRLLLARSQFSILTADMVQAKLYLQQMHKTIQGYPEFRMLQFHHQRTLGDIAFIEDQPSTAAQFYLIYLLDEVLNCNPSESAYALSRLADTSLAREDLETAEALTCAICPLLKCRMRVRRELGACTLRLAEISRRRGDITSAREWHRVAKRYYFSTGDKAGRDKCTEMAESCFKRGSDINARFNPFVLRFNLS